MEKRFEDLLTLTYITIKYADALAIATNKSTVKFVKGSSYRITNRVLQGTGTTGDVVVTAVGDYELAISGQLYAGVPDYKNGKVWKKTNVATEVIHLGKTWDFITGGILTSEPIAGSISWAIKITPSTTGVIPDTNGNFIYEWDEILYTLSLDWINERKDKRGNVISMSTAGGSDYRVSSPVTIDQFAWGHDSVFSNHISDSILNEVFLRGTIRPYISNNVINETEFRGIVGSLDQADTTAINGLDIELCTFNYAEIDSTTANYFQSIISNGGVFRNNNFAACSDSLFTGSSVNGLGMPAFTCNFTGNTVNDATINSTTAPTIATVFNDIIIRGTIDMVLNENHTNEIIGYTDNVITTSLTAQTTNLTTEITSRINADADLQSQVLIAGRSKQWQIGGGTGNPGYKSGQLLYNSIGKDFYYLADITGANAQLEPLTLTSTAITNSLVHWMNGQPVWKYIGDPANNNISLDDPALIGILQPTAVGNVYGLFFANNVRGNDSTVNVYGNYCQQNTFGTGSGYNSYGNNNRNNTYGNNHIHNRFADFIQDCVFGDNLTYCNFHDNAEYLQVGANCSHVDVYNCNGTYAIPFVIPAGSTNVVYRNNKLVGDSVQATATTLGLVKVGANLTILADGTLNAPAPGTNYALPQASDVVLGGVKLGKGLTYNTTTGKVDGFTASGELLRLTSKAYYFSPQNNALQGYATLQAALTDNYNEIISNYGTGQPSNEPIFLTRAVGSLVVTSSLDLCFQLFGDTADPLNVFISFGVKLKVSTVNRVSYAGDSNGGGTLVATTYPSAYPQPMYLSNGQCLINFDFAIGTPYAASNLYLNNYAITKWVNTSGAPVTVYLQGNSTIPAAPYPTGITIVDQRNITVDKIGTGLLVNSTTGVISTATVSGDAYGGLWNPTTNVPSLSVKAGNAGQYYRLATDSPPPTSTTIRSSFYDTVLDVVSTAGIKIGMIATGTGIPAGVRVINVSGINTLELDTLTNLPTNTAVTFTFNFAGQSFLAANSWVWYSGTSWEVRLLGPVTTGIFRGPWTPNTLYSKNDTVTQGGASYYANTTFTSGTSFVVTNWSLTASPVQVANTLTPTATSNTDAASVTAVNTGITTNANAIALKANIDSPTFTGIPAANTAAIYTSTTQLATTEFVQTAFNKAPLIVAVTAGGTINSTFTDVRAAVEYISVGIGGGGVGRVTVNRSINGRSDNLLIGPNTILDLNGNSLNMLNGELHLYPGAKVLNNRLIYNCAAIVLRNGTGDVIIQGGTVVAPTHMSANTTNRVIYDGVAIQNYGTGGTSSTDGTGIIVLRNGAQFSGYAPNASTTIITETISDTFSVLPYATSIAIDFNAENVRTLNATGNISYGASLNVALLKTKEHYIYNSTGAPITLAFPTGWTFFPGPAPTTLAAGKQAVLSLRCLGTTDSTIKAAYVAQT